VLQLALNTQTSAAVPPAPRSEVLAPVAHEEGSTSVPAMMAAPPGCPPGRGGTGPKTWGTAEWASWCALSTTRPVTKLECSAAVPWPASELAGLRRLERSHGGTVQKRRQAQRVGNYPRRAGHCTALEELAVATGKRHVGTFSVCKRQHRLPYGFEGPARSRRRRTRAGDETSTEGEIEEGTDADERRRRRRRRPQALGKV
jgi:hypothetical protein